MVRPKGLPTYGSRYRHGGAPANNASGLVGIRAAWQRNRNGSRSRVLRVAWCWGGDQGRTTISIDLHGPIEACRKAMALRRNHMGIEPPMSPRSAWARLRLMLTD